MAEIAEQLRSQESQTKFLEQARTDLLSQFRALSGKMLDGSRDALLKTTNKIPVINSTNGYLELIFVEQ